MKIKNIVLLIFVLSFVQSYKAKNVQHIEAKSNNLKDLRPDKPDFWDKYSSGLIAGLTVFASLGISVWQARASQRHSKALSIADARIKWIEELRPLLGKLISDTSIFEYELKRRVRSAPKTELNSEEPLYKKLADLNLTFNEVKLLLNHDKTEHLNFINYVNAYIDKSINIAKGINEEHHEINEDGLILAARIILEKAWKQAKNEG